MAEERGPEEVAQGAAVREPLHGRHSHLRIGFVAKPQFGFVHLERNAEPGDEQVGDGQVHQQVVCHAFQGCNEFVSSVYWVQ